MLEVLRLSGIIIADAFAERAYKDAKRDHRPSSKLFRRWVVAKSRVAAERV